MSTFTALADLVLPRQCAGCRRPGALLCSACRVELATPPTRVFPPTNPYVPVFSLGTYAGAHRGVVLAMKERHNLAVRRHIGAVLDAALKYLEARGDLPADAVLIPAPTRPSNARARGGDPVEVCCRATNRKVAAVLQLDEKAADQTNLDAAARRSNLAGSVRVSGVPAGECVVVDDVVTTGATLQASVEKLLACGVDVVGCVTVCCA